MSWDREEDKIASGARPMILRLRLPRAVDSFFSLAQAESGKWKDSGAHAAPGLTRRGFGLGVDFAR